MKIGIFILILISIVGVHGVGQGHVRAQGITMGCKEGWFSLNKYYGSCYECDTNCKTCSSLEVCTSCHEGMELKFHDRRRTSCVCREGYNSGDRCKQCAYTCKTCFGPRHRHCSSCNPGRALKGSRCSKCHNTCKTCIGLRYFQCSSCYPGKGLRIHKGKYDKRCY